MTSSPLLTTAQAYYTALATLDTDRLNQLLVPEYQHTFYPASEGLGPPLSRDEFIGRFAALAGVLSGLTVNILQSWPNEAARTITILATNAPNFQESAKRPEDTADEWTFSGEYMFVLTMDESGEKVVSSLEFVEGKATDKMKAQIGKAFQRLGGGL